MNTQKWTDEIDKITALFRQRFGALNNEQLNFKPAPSVWSIAQNIDHLRVINETYYPVIRQVRDNTYKYHWMSRFGFMVNFIGKTVLNSVGPDRRKKMKTFPIWEPSQSRIEGDILENFEKHQQQLKEFIVSCSDLLDKGLVISSPANKAIVYKLETAFDIIVTHEARHLEQATEMLKLLP
jgi:hypothetical protein